MYIGWNREEISLGAVFEVSNARVAASRHSGRVRGWSFGDLQRTAGRRVLRRYPVEDARVVELKCAERLAIVALAPIRKLVSTRPTRAFPANPNQILTLVSKHHSL